MMSKKLQEMDIISNKVFKILKKSTLVNSEVIAMLEGIKLDYILNTGIVTIDSVVGPSEEQLKRIKRYKK